MPKANICSRSGPGTNWAHMRQMLSCFEVLLKTFAFLFVVCLRDGDLFDAEADDEFCFTAFCFVMADTEELLD